MIDYTLDYSSNYPFFNINDDEIFMSPKPNLFENSVNFNDNFDSKFPPLFNDGQEEEQHSAIFDNMVNPEENLFLQKDDNDKIDAIYHATEMIPEENLGDHMQINEEAVQKIFDISKVNKTNRKSIPFYPRIDDWKIYWRAKINKYYIEEINSLIEKSDLPKELKKIIHAPYYKGFTIKVKCSSTKEDLGKKMRTILTIGHETQKNQSQNLRNIQAIINYNLNNQSESVQKIVDLLNKTYEEVIGDFYVSPKLLELCNDDTAKFYDEEFIKQKGFSLFEKDGLIRIFRDNQGNEKGNKGMLGKKRAIKKVDP